MRFEIIAAMLTAVIAFGTAKPVLAQKTDDDAVKGVVRAETEAFYTRNFEAWQDAWLHDPGVTRTLIAYGSNSSQKGWDTVSGPVAKGMAASPQPVPIELAVENVAIRREGNLAWVEYDQTLTSPRAPGLKNRSREQRVLVKSLDKWKIASQISVSSGSYDNTPENVERRINSVAYNLLDAKKTAEAIDMLRVNVRLYPESWNAYDSLAEAFAAAGEKELAIQNYEKSISLNPRNETGKAALAKLREK
jgi:tetratricopeptide (TPR) repeat protein